MNDRTQRPGYGWRALMGDATGGLLAALIALPYGLAMAAAMGLPPALGLLTSLLTAPITAALGRNPVLIGGPSSVTVPFLAAAVRAEGVGGAAKVGLAAAGFMLLFAGLRLGRQMARVPLAVVSGFSCGIGAMMVIGQLRTILGLPAAPGPGAGNMVRVLAGVLGSLGSARWHPLAIGSTVVAVAYLASRRSARLPAPMIGVAAAVALARGLGWDDEQSVGPVLLDGVGLAGFTLRPSDVVDVLPPAFGLAVVASINLLITARVVEHFRGRHEHARPGDADRELAAYGLANLGAGAFGAPTSVGIPARSLANLRCGGTTRLSNLFHAAALAGLVALGSDAIAAVPLAALAGVTAYVGLRLLDWSTWRRLPRMRRLDAAAFLLTFGLVLTTNAAVAVGLGCSLYLARRAAGRLARPAPAPEAPTAG